MRNDIPRISWGIKDSFRQYVAAIIDGTETPSEGAFVEDGTFSFPFQTETENEFRFYGRTDITGYNGILNVQVQNPWLHVSQEGVWLTIVDPAYRGDITKRIRFCSLDSPMPDIGETQSVVFRAKLDSVATRIFDDVYPPGVELDNVTVVLPDLTKIVPVSENP